MKRLKSAKFQTAIIMLNIAIGILLLVLIHLEINKTIDVNKQVYINNQKNLIKSMLERALIEEKFSDKNIEEVVSDIIKKDFPTSSSYYCIFTKENEILFIKDENTTESLKGQSLRDLLSQELATKQETSKYLVADMQLKLDNNSYSFSIYTKESYFIKQMNFNNISLYTIVYFLLYMIMQIITTVLAFYAMREDKRTIEALNEKSINDRMLIDKLESDKTDRYVITGEEGVYSFYPRSVVEEVKVQLTAKEKENCVQIDFIIDNLKMEHFVGVSIVLDRIKMKNSVACYWEENIFRVLTFNAEEEDVRSFIDLFLRTYQDQCKEKIEELKIVARYLDDKEFPIAEMR